VKPGLSAAKDPQRVFRQGHFFRIWTTPVAGCGSHVLHSLDRETETLTGGVPPGQAGCIGGFVVGRFSNRSVS